MKTVRKKRTNKQLIIITKKEGKTAIQWRKWHIYILSCFTDSHRCMTIYPSELTSVNLKGEITS